MSLYVAKVGEVIIRPEYRKDMGHFVRGEYDEITDPDLREFIDEYGVRKGASYDFIEIRLWRHNDYKDEWKGKYETAYDEETGRFIYGVSYNLHSSGFRREAMWDFFHLFRDKLTEEVVFNDGFAED